MKSLCHDFNFEVRKAITSKINNIFNLLEKDEGDKHMHRIILELLDDEEAEVKHLAIKAFFENIDKFTQHNIEENLMEVACNVINEACSRDSASGSYILDNLDEFIENNQYFRKFLGSPEGAEKQSEEFQNIIIYKSSGFIETMGSEYFFDNLYEKYASLAKEESKTEPENSPKYHIAADIHKVVKNLGSINGYKNDFEKNITSLLNDKLLPVIGVLLENLHEVADILLVYDVTDEMKELGIEKKIANFKTAFIKNFIKIEDKIKDNWRFLNLWIDCAFRIMHKMHEFDPPCSTKIEGTSMTLK